MINPRDTMTGPLLGTESSRDHDTRRTQVTGQDIRVHIVAGGSTEVVPVFTPIEFSATTEEPKHWTARDSDTSGSGPLGVAPRAGFAKNEDRLFFANPLESRNYFTFP